MPIEVPVKLIGFAPDYDISTPGVITDSGPFIPTINGIGPVNSLVSVGIAALGSACRGAAVARKIDDSRRVFAGTQTGLYEASTTTWTDASKGGGYTGGTENRWRFVQYGNDTIATNRTDAVQVSASGAFADLGGTPPKASIVEACQGFVLLFDYNDGVNDYPDGWWCSALRNDASWSPSIATQAANNRLLDTPGAIRAARSLGNVVVAYKERSMYLGTYQGPPVIWDWQVIPGDVGAVSQEAVASVIIDNIPCHIFAGFDGFYRFDGARPQFIGNPLKNWYNANTSATYRYRVQSMPDPLTQNVYFFLPDASGNLTFGVVYNYRSDRWGYLSSVAAVEASLAYLSAGVTWDGLGTLYSTWDSLPADISYDSPFWTSGAATPAVFGSDHILRSYTGTPAASAFITGYTGDAGSFRTLTRIRPRFNAYPSGSYAATVYHTQNLGAAAPSSMTAASLNNGKIDALKSSKWFAHAVAATGAYEQTGYSYYFEQDGEE